MDRRIIAAVSSVALAGFGTAAHANSYAGTITESGGTVAFRLNEPASEVVVIRDGVAQSLGALGLGSHSFPRNGAANYSIVVRTDGAPGWETASSPGNAIVNQISDDFNTFYNFDRLPGMAINTNPATPALFGRVYGAAPRDFTTGFGRAVTRGVFIINPDGSEAIAGQGATGMTGGLTFLGNGTSPWRLDLDAEGNVYIGDWSDGNGSVYRTGPDVGNSGGINLFTGTGGTAPIDPSTMNHGSNAALAVRGGPAAGNLTVYTIDEDLTTTGQLTQLNSLWRYNLGSATGNYTGTPTRITGNLIDFTEGIQADLDIGPDGKFYQLQLRFDGNEPSVFVNAPDGTLLYDTLSDSQARGIDGNPGLDGIQDALRNSRNIAISEDGRYMAANTALGGDVWIVPLLAGIPDLTNRLLLDAYAGSTGDEVVFDPAGNLYAFNRTDELIRIFSPGGTSVTSFNSNGTFSMDPTYTGGAGNYSTSGSWLIGVVPNGVNQVARFAGPGGNVTMDTAVTLGAIKFDSPSSYTLGGSNTITLDGLSPNVISRQGSHTIAAPLLLKRSTGLVADGGSITIQNLSVDTGAAVPVEIYTGGSGVVSANRFVAQGLFVTAGTTRVIPGGTSASTSNVKQLRIAGGAAPIAKLDITNNAFVVDYASGGTSPLADIRAQITSAYNGGAWNGNGITSSNANASNFGIGYAEASALASVPAIFGTVDADAVLFRQTRYGDANLDGLVNLTDFNRLAANFGATDGDWSRGDFNYDSNVNLSDFNRLAANFGLSAAGPEVTPQDWARLGAAVPEPSSLALVGIGALAAMRRRRRYV